MRAGLLRKFPSVVLVTMGVCLLLWQTPLIISLLKPTYNSIADYFNRSHAHSSAQTSTSNTLAVKASDSAHKFNYPNLGISAPFILTDNTNPLSYSDWNKIRATLKQGLNVSYNGESYDDARLIYVIGHSSDYDAFNPFATVFASLGQAKTGDTFTVSFGDKQFTYSVVEKKTLKPTDEQGFKGLASNDDHIQRVVLVTCWPVLTTWNRLVVVGERHL
jgi:LPXTG-site transpeptidase (sortase) family protein